MHRSRLIIIATLLIIITLVIIIFVSWRAMLPPAPLPQPVDYSASYQHPDCSPVNVSQNVVTALIKPDAVCGLILRSSSQAQLLFDNAAKFNRLQIITAANLGLTKIPDSIDNFTSLHTLDLNSNQLKDLPASLGNLSSLRLLNLRNNNFSNEKLKQIEKQKKAEVVY